MRKTIQEHFDGHAAALRLGGTAKPSKSVTNQTVANTYQALESISMVDVPPDVQSPFWLTPYEDWNADDLLILNNGLLNVASFTQGIQPNFIPPTAKLFYRFQSQFGFDTNAPKPTVWHNFLDSLEQDEDWIACLQEIFGYLLWPGYDLQKYFVLCGPPRSGKGTIVGVVENLIGGPAALCSPSIEDFGTNFGLEQAIGKRLAVVPEVHQFPRRMDESVSRLKAITGETRLRCIGSTCRTFRCGLTFGSSCRPTISLRCQTIRARYSHA